MQSDGNLKQKLMDMIPNQYRQERLDTSRISLLPDMSTGKYTYSERA